jgi:hypothetical protein
LTNQSCHLERNRTILRKAESYVTNQKIRSISFAIAQRL